MSPDKAVDAVVALISQGVRDAMPDVEWFQRLIALRQSGDLEGAAEMISDWVMDPANNKSVRTIATGVIASTGCQFEASQIKKQQRKEGGSWRSN